MMIYDSGKQTIKMETYLIETTLDAIESELNILIFENVCI